MKPVVFLSHIHEDSEIAKRIKEWLEDRLLGAIDVFVSSDGSSIRGGDRWMEIVETALRSSKIVIVLCTPSSTQRRWVFFEAGGAYFLGARVIPVCTAGLTPDRLDAPLSFLQAFELTDSENLRQLLSEVANYAGLRTPAVDLSADVEWIATGIRREAQVKHIATPEIAYSPVTRKEITELIAQIPQETRTAAERALLMFEYMYKNDWHGEKALARLQEAPGWVRHFVTKLQKAGLPLPTSPGGEGKRRASVRDIEAHLKTLSTQEGWTQADALLDLEPLLPDAIPIVVADVLEIETLEYHNFLGWWMQLDLLARLVLHDDPLIVRAIGTVARQDGFQESSSFTDGLVRYARQLLFSESEFERWFLAFAGIKYQDYRIRREAVESELREMTRRRD